MLFRNTLLRSTGRFSTLRTISHLSKQTFQPCVPSMMMMQTRSYSDKQLLDVLAQEYEEEQQENEHLVLPTLPGWDLTHAEDSVCSFICIHIYYNPHIHI